MTGENRLTLAVAGGRKTQSIVEACADNSKRRLLVTYTTTGQKELRERLDTTYGVNSVEVIGWYSFLISHFVYPYLKAKYPRRTVQGFNFQYVVPRGAQEEDRYFDLQGSLTRAGLSRLSYKLADKTGGAPYDRLSYIYDEIYFDEVQDLTGWDLELLKGLLESKLTVALVGDIRQSVYDTNDQDQKNKQYRGLKMIGWFREQEKTGKLQIHESLDNWRCRPEIVELANRVFAGNNKVSPAVSKQTGECEHQGLFRVNPKDVDDYVKTHRPLTLRWNAQSGRALQEVCTFQNMGKVKGITTNHVLILPTKSMVQFLTSRVPNLKEQTACKLYVAITRARFSVAFILDDDVQTNQLQHWPTP